MTPPGQTPHLWDLVEKAAFDPEVTKLHLTVGRPPMIRVGDEGLRPLDGDYPVLTHRLMMAILCTVVEPERWAQYEQIGEGEVRLHTGYGRPITLTIFRNSDSWSAVVHF